MLSGIEQRLFHFFILLFCCTGLSAADLSQSGGIDQELRNQTLRQESFENELRSDKDVRLLAPDSVQTGIFPEETPCFVISDLELKGDEFFPTLDFDIHRGRVVGQCLGYEGINQVFAQVQNNLIGQGFVTSRVLVPSQDLSSGTLVLQLVPGVLGKKVGTEKIHASLLVPGEPGEVLDLRDLEQGLENLQRLPTANADIQIQPGEKPGQSDLIINYQLSIINRPGNGE